MVPARWLSTAILLGAAAAAAGEVARPTDTPGGEWVGAGEDDAPIGGSPRPLLDVRTGAPNLCVYPTYVVIGRWIDTSAEQVPRLGILTTGTLLVERVLRDESSEVRSGHTLEILVPGGRVGELEMTVSGQPYPHIGEWWVVAMALWGQVPERVLTEPLSEAWIPHLPGESALRSVADRLCEEHPEGVYYRDLFTRSLQTELTQLLRSPGIRLGPLR